MSCITPGTVLTETDSALRTIQESAADLAEAPCFFRREAASDVEGAFVFHASADSDLMTGQTLNVNGGWMMHQQEGKSR